jgi:hypothetical protein
MWPTIVICLVTVSQTTKQGRHLYGSGFLCLIFHAVGTQGYAPILFDMELSTQRRTIWFCYSGLYLVTFGLFSDRAGLLALWGTDKFTPTLSDVVGASIGVAFTLAIFAEYFMVLFAIPLIEKLKNDAMKKGREQGLEEGRQAGQAEGREAGREEAREESRQQLEAAKAALADAYARIATLEGANARKPDEDNTA